MGTWGVGVLDDDVAREVYGNYLDRYDGEAHAAIRAALEARHAAELADEDDGPVFWFALAQAQWECGVLEPDVRGRVADLIASGRTLGRWEEAGAATVRQRRRALERFLDRLGRPRLRPRRRRPVRHTPAVYRPGDCLAVRLEDGDWGAALVLAADETDRAQGWNLVGVLRYKGRDRPGPDVFERREWLCPSHHSWRGDRPELQWCPARLHPKDGGGLEVVGRVALREDDPRESNVFGGWDQGLQPVLQARWDAGERE